MRAGAHDVLVAAHHLSDCEEAQDQQRPLVGQLVLHHLRPHRHHLWCAHTRTQNQKAVQTRQPEHSPEGVRNGCVRNARIPFQCSSLGSTAYR